MNMQQARCIAQSYGIYGDYTQRKVSDLLTKAVEYDEICKRARTDGAKRLAEMSVSRLLYVAEAVEYIVSRTTL